ncbi:protein kinase domain-containing protein [Rhodopirellula halodulae]|uniref:serine/threonine-protein kinase n=1 Tax=Rhodopirellula halodulae TaxID=2894198 RepID=UPI003F684715
MDSRSLPPADSSHPDRSAVLPEGSTVQRRQMAAAESDAASQSAGPELPRSSGRPTSSERSNQEAELAEASPSDESRSSGKAARSKSSGSAFDEVIEGADTVIRAGSSRSNISATQSHRMTGDSFPLRGSSHNSHRANTPASITRELGGQRLNHFLLLDQIGGGGMGAVFRARDEQLGRTVAVKVIPFAADDPDLQRRFRNEAQSAAKLDHPLIARVFDVGNDGPWHYIVFEYIDGANVRDMVANEGPLSLDDALYFTIQVAEAIGHASRRGIVHRDIKPSNVIVTTDGSVKLVDMGLARSDNFDTSEDMTASGVTLGTFDYISPEQARDPRLADIRSDLYSLGCSLFYMLTGSPPFPGGTMLQKLLSHGNAAIPDVREQREDVPAEVTAILNKMLAKTPEERYQRSETLIADLRELAARENLPRSRGVAVTMVEDDDHRESMRRLRRHLPWMIAAAVLLFSALAVELISLPTRREFNRVVSSSVSEDAIESKAPRSIDLPPGIQGELRTEEATGSGTGTTNPPGTETNIESTPRATADANLPNMNGTTNVAPGITNPGLLPPGQLLASSVGDRIPDNGVAATGTASGGTAGMPDARTLPGDASPTAGALSGNTATSAIGSEIPSLPPNLQPGSVVSGSVIPGNTPLAGGLTASEGVSPSSTETNAGNPMPSLEIDPPQLSGLPLPPGMGNEVFQTLPLVPRVVEPDEATMDTAPATSLTDSATDSATDRDGNTSPLTGDSVGTPVPPNALAASMLLPNAERSADMVAGIDSTSPRSRTNGSPTEAMTIPAPTRIQIVSAEALRVPQLREEAARAGVQLATTLADALQLSNEFEIERIDIATPKLVSAPVIIPRSDLILSSSLPGGTEIVFRSTDNVDMQRSEMMTIGSHRIEMSGLHFSWTVPATETDGGALFAINDNRRVRLRDCSITIDNATRRDDVQAFSVVTDPERLPYDRIESTAVTQTNGALPLVSIEMFNVIIRGQITMLRMDVAAELQLLWENGLLAVSRRMIEMGGALEPPRPSSGSVRLSLEQLTAITPKGLLQMRMGVSSRYPVEIERRAEECVFVVDAGIPHIELTGIPRVDRDEIWVRLRGSGNAYDTDTTLDDPMLLIRDELGQTRITTMSDLLEILEDPPPWMNERPPRWTVRWTEKLPETTPSNRWTPSDFRQDGSVVGGFQERTLPRMPMEATFDFPPSP